MKNIARRIRKTKKNVEPDFCDAVGVIADEISIKQVTGEGDCERGIYTGDWLVIDKSKKPVEGEIVIIKIDGENDHFFGEFSAEKYAGDEIVGVVLFHARKLKADDYGILDAEVIR